MFCISTKDVTSTLPPVQSADAVIISSCRQQEQLQQPPAQLLLTEQKQQQQHQQQQSSKSPYSTFTTTNPNTTNNTTPTSPQPTFIPTKSINIPISGGSNPFTNTPGPPPLRQQNQKVITRSQSSKVIQELQQLHHNNNNYQQQSHQHSIHQLKQQQSLPATLHPPQTVNGSHHPPPSKSVSILVYKTLNTVFKSSRKIIVRVCEVASAKKSFTMFKFNKAAAQNRAENRANACTGHDQFVRPPVPEKWVRKWNKKLYEYLLCKNDHGEKFSN